jgi:beta-glucanase (GH16 family)
MTRSMLMLLACAAGGLAQTSEWKLTWRDEFDGAKLDPSKWEYVVGGNGFGNRELEYYTGRARNLYLENGMLTIQALKEDYSGADGVKRSFTSARIQTKGKFAQAYGKFEARIKIPYGQGIWPAFWMMGDAAAEWPANGEIDIMENIGREPAMVHGTVHGPGYSGEHGIGAPFSLAGGPMRYDVGAGWSSLVARWAHNPKVEGSNPSPATNLINRLRGFLSVPQTPINSQ